MSPLQAELKRWRDAVTCCLHANTRTLIPHWDKHKMWGNLLLFVSFDQELGKVKYTAGQVNAEVSCVVYLVTHQWLIRLEHHTHIFWVNHKVETRKPPDNLKSLIWRRWWIQLYSTVSKPDLVPTWWHEGRLYWSKHKDRKSNRRKQHICTRAWKDFANVMAT